MPMTDGGTARYLRRQGIIARRVAGEMLLVPVGIGTTDPRHRTAELFVLNETGERMWDWLAAPISEADLARKLIAEYEVSAESAAADVSAFLHALLEIDMIGEVE